MNVKVKVKCVSSRLCLLSVIIWRSEIQSHKYVISQAYETLFFSVGLAFCEFSVLLCLC
jgi:hypothetical protein